MSDNDIINLHWINGEMLSVGDIASIKKPVVWTLHDMWAFCGAEHYSQDKRWIEGYTSNVSKSGLKGLDLNRYVWSKKKALWNRPFQVVTPSHWLADCVRSSDLMHDWPVTVIHNAIDTELWRPSDKLQSRIELGLPENVNIILFGAIGGSKDPRKGYDLLERALHILKEHHHEIMLVVVGQSEPEVIPDLGFPVHFTGHISSERDLIKHYSAADLVVIPSRQDNLPNMGVEALACGRPLVGFDTCGLPDLVKHHQTGYLAKAFDCEDLARGMAWVMRQKPGDLTTNEQTKTAPLDLENNCRLYAEETFAYPVVAKQYEELFTSVK
jgi:glycosyltransferase involved in cell wall biosynthesis